MHPDKNCKFLSPCLLLLTFATLPDFCEKALCSRWCCFNALLQDLHVIVNWSSLFSFLNENSRLMMICCGIASHAVHIFEKRRLWSTCNWEQNILFYCHSVSELSQISLRKTQFHSNETCKIYANTILTGHVVARNIRVLNQIILH